MSQHLETFPGHLNGQYPYESLPRNAIRILTILPGLQGDVVRCTISHARLKTGDSDVAPQYTALSYVWGDPRVREEILVDGFKVSVTENLYLALRHLQHKSATRRVWADALCINQGDLAEKRYQIELMKYIYMLADEVVM
ncbi:HET-domain-containing protein, partial [Polyplosphaeria fusca]